ncbi:phosphonate ABC transporter, permease protein PhnE [Microbacterium karelineae]|uniref:phosphonate ABC transporter, permease protein PhnE n=1 Tax=Microbacterium karelineae TaxID=2654283 RepID=UPI001E5C8DA4|nr:phosphonate ABC transporter, permease protein PhnE [Microbacterium karelineae]
MATIVPVAPQRSAQRGLPVPKRPAPAAQTVAVWAVMLGFLAAAIWSFVELDISFATIASGLEYAADFISRTMPLDFPPIGELVSLTLQTLAIVTIATALSVMLSLPIAIFAASATTPSRWLGGASRTLIVVLRAIPDLVLAIIFFRMFGLGAVPGILAMGLHSVGMVGKLYADAIEELDRGPVEALRAAGASRWQQILSGVIPPLMPQIVATALHRFDINLRTSVILGYVGVGGIGLALADALNTMNYQRGMALALVVLVLCVVIELISGGIRTALLGRSNGRRRGILGALDRLSDGWVTRPDATHEPQRAKDGSIRTAPQWDGERIRRFLGLSAVVVIVGAAIVGAEIDPVAFVVGLVDLPQTAVLFFPPSDGGLWDKLLDAMIVTVQIGLASTLIGVVIAIPIGSLAARNVAPNAAVAMTFRVLIVCVRAFPELILAIIFIVIMGLGPVPGALALGIGSIGLLGKLVADSLEESDVRVQDAVRTGGATGVQVYAAATLRQALPAFVAHIMYQLDVNIRAATLLGIVGAGGIGFYLMQAHRVLEFDVVTFIIILILAVVLTLEAISAWVRRVVI